MLISNGYQWLCHATMYKNSEFCSLKLHSLYGQDSPMHKTTSISRGRKEPQPKGCSKHNEKEEMYIIK